MAISFIDRYYSGHISSGLNIPMTIPSGAQSGDTMIAYCHQSENTSEQDWDDDGGGGNGWTRLRNDRTTGGRDMETAIYYKVHTGSESDPTFTWAEGITGEPMSGSLLVYRGADTNSEPVITYKNSTNDGNPPNPMITVNGDNSTVICIHSQTHDDVTESAPPTGFTFRTDGWLNSTDDHMNHYIADITGINAGDYTPPDWQHTVANTTPEYHTYSIALIEPVAIGVQSYDTSLNWGNTDKTVGGFGFESSQGTGKVEFWSDQSGTIKQAQTIDSWSDTSVQFDTVQGSLLDDTVNYLIITNNNGDRSIAKVVSFGLPTYKLVVQAIEADHLWMFDNDYTDEGFLAGGDAAQSVVGTHPWTDAICEGAAKSMQFDDILDRREAPDSPHMNITIDSAERTVAGWIQLGGVQQSMGAIWKEGGGVQNLALISGLGNVLMAQAADSPGNAINAQAVASIKLTPNRPYHFAMRYTLTETPKEFRLYLDGVEQPYALTNGNPFGSGSFNSHSGDITWGNSDNNLETGGTDIAYAGQENCKYNAWCSWSDDSSVGGALNKETHIRDVLFRRGALPKYTIDSDTEANMQSDLDAQLEDSEVEDYPLGIRVQANSGSNDLTLTANSLTFNDRTSIQVEWRGVGELTWIVSGTSAVDESKFISTKGGTISFEYPAILTIGGIINGAEVRLYDDNVGDSNYGTELDGTESNSGTTFNYSHSGTTNNVIIQMMEDGYEEVIVPTTLGANNQTVTLLPKVDKNK